LLELSNADFDLGLTGFNPGQIDRLTCRDFLCQSYLPVVIETLCLI
jgi:hypothetical protein